ncbi:MAG: sigma-54 dependent transcriptional regulator [Gammaproteobacteria bacterium]
MGTILIVEDEMIIRKSLCRLLSRYDHIVSEAESVEEALSLYTLTDFDLILTDLRLPGESGTALIAPAAPKPVLVMTSYASLKSAIEAMKLGAANYIAKPFDHDEMVKMVRQLIENPTSVPSPKPPTEPTTPVLIGDSSAMRSRFETLTHVAPTQTTLIITGETGTGKTTFAHKAHALSGRSGPLLCLDSATLSATLNDNAAVRLLFGDSANASPSQAGLIKAAHGGTLLIREISELSLAAQALLLHTLESRTVQPAGATQTEPVDIRVIVTSQTPLNQLSAKGRLREDLYYRLMGVPIGLPPLYERTGDVLLLAEHFVSLCATLHQKPKLRLCHASRLLIERYHWPGNVRELRHTLERAAALTRNDIITPELMFCEDLDALAAATPATSTATAADDDMSLDEYFQHVVLENQHHMTETELAQKLGISRKTLWERRQKMGIPRKRPPPPLSPDAHTPSADPGSATETPTELPQ